MNKPRIVVIGSINMDLVTEVSSWPKLGETMLGKNFYVKPGGKGANQAVASSRLGAEVMMIGCVGDDVFGKQLIMNLKNEKVNTEHVDIISNVSSGIATVIIYESDNSIAVVQGANKLLTPEVIRNKISVIKKADIILMQLEIPIETVYSVIDIADSFDIPIILNPAPSIQLAKEKLDKITVLTPNEYELLDIFDHNLDNSEDFKQIMSKSSGQVVMTKGEEGAFYTDGLETIEHIPGIKVQAVDTTGAGDTFNGALAYQLSRGENLREATKFAVAASALSVTKVGAQEGMPTSEDVDYFLKQKN